MNDQYRKATKLLMHIRDKELRVLSVTSSSRTSWDKVLSHHLLTHISGKRNLKFIEGLLSKHNRMNGWSHRPLLQNLMDCAMMCHEFRFIQPSDDDLIQSQLQIECRKLAERCFYLAKNLIEGKEPHALLLFNCVVSCRLCADLCKIEKTSPKFEEVCKSCEEICLAYYQKTSLN